MAFKKKTIYDNRSKNTVTEYATAYKKSLWSYAGIFALIITIFEF